MPLHTYTIEDAINDGNVLPFRIDYINIVKQKEGAADKEVSAIDNNSFRDGTLKTIGTDIDKILPPVSRFDGGRATKEQGVIDRLTKFFEKYFGLV